MNQFIYPPSPLLPDPNIIQPSATFKKQVTKVIIAIILFFIVYLVLIIAAIALAVVCCYLGVVLIVEFPSFVVLIAGLGMIAVGISVLFFLIKFIFAVSKNENPSRVEITEADQPQLFNFIRQLTTETATPFPNKIYISPDVNACVFYNSSFWSMFLPVKKNLEIGLGLVNSINMSELKAVLAHEFGHFSQRSMKLGSFTYNVNRVIYNILFENTSYTTFLQTWGGLHSILALFANITIKIAQGIQYILRAMYKVINKSYLGLSREMEYHADAVAASVSGGNNLVSALSRIDVANSCYNTALDKADELLKNKKATENIFSNQLAVLHNVADKFKLPLVNGLPTISYEFVHSFSSARVNFKDQWASHPQLDERKRELDKLQLNIAPNESPAWHIFNHPENLQQLLTENLYRNIPAKDQLEIFTTTEFKEWQLTENVNYEFPAAYNGFYDGRVVSIPISEIISLANIEPQKTFEEIFTSDNAKLQATIKSYQNDYNTIKAIQNKEIDVTNFDFDGIKFSRKDCDTILTQLQTEIDNKEQALSILDKAAFTLFTKYGSNITDSYLSLQKVNEQYNSYVIIANDLLNFIQTFYTGSLTAEQVAKMVGTLKHNHEKKLRTALLQIIEGGILSANENEIFHKKVNSFLEKDYYYFVSNQFQNDELDMLRTVTIETAEILSNYRFKLYKQLLEMQLQQYEAKMNL
ncbi:M48 family metalloprotease [Limnovirga soli]|uniref:M48 family metalloprotease n=1 Tax=Limnovirga soli TaxID=2656915 RepID=A0A8J8FH41_9BACT|nr:M48 family metalloprotease [Limnovirga soli]NNV58016.1 M48 family metalloprotease [Limnovirga soli]